MKVDLPSFDGSMDAESFLEWVEHVKYFFNYMGIEEDERDSLVKIKLRGGPLAYWKRLQKDK